MAETPTVTLADFLLARIAEDEEARFASGDHWDRLADGNARFRKVVAWGLTPIGAMNAVQDAIHIARWDPARVLAECDAKRRIVVRCQEMQTAAVPMAAHLASATLADLALPYADHPDYDEEWRG